MTHSDSGIAVLFPCYTLTGSFVCGSRPGTPLLKCRGFLRASAGCSDCWPGIDAGHQPLTYTLVPRALTWCYKSSAKSRAVSFGDSK